MRTTCEGCGRQLGAVGDAWICSFECTFCPDCARGANSTCPNCGGELVPRPKRIKA
ncbi:MAG: DUF1272 domain-containing protein [Chloroflexi bacterium]|nr:MAG: DUF1272 domain-containing protein [Chloroflexota bacterium]